MQSMVCIPKGVWPFIDDGIYLEIAVHPVVGTPSQDVIDKNIGWGNTKVGESSVVAAARQLGSTMARRVDYSFVDTVDANIRDTKRRTMVAIEVVNLRVRYQADVRRRESLEFYAWHQDTQTDRAAVRAEIESEDRRGWNGMERYEIDSAMGSGVLGGTACAWWDPPPPPQALGSEERIAGGGDGDQTDVGSRWCVKGEVCRGGRGDLRDGWFDEYGRVGGMPCKWSVGDELEAEWQLRNCRGVWENRRWEMRIDGRGGSDGDECEELGEDGWGEVYDVVVRWCELTGRVGGEIRLTREEEESGWEGGLGEVDEDAVFLREGDGNERMEEERGLRGGDGAGGLKSEAYNRELEARIATMETQLHHMEWLRQDANDHAVRHIMRTQTLEVGARVDTLEDTALKRTATTTTTTAVTDAQLKALIARGVSDVLAEIKANRTSKNGDDSHDSGTGSRRTERAARECNYSDFLKCQPLNFKGTEGVVGLTQWFKRWNLSFISTVSHNVAYAMTWKALKKMMTDKYCSRGEIKKLEIEMFPEESDEIEKYVGGLPDMIYGSVMASKPKTMQDAIEFATKLMDQKNCTLAERRRNITNDLNLCAPNVTITMMCSVLPNVPTARGLAIRPVIVEAELLPTTTTIKTRAPKGRIKEFLLAFPKLRNKNQGNQVGNGNAVARAYAMGIAGTNPNSNVVMGTFLLNNRYALILFDTGADRSFVSTAFSSLIDIIPTILDYSYDVELGDGRII
ncbi:putative reverse transcriptase domain-containing protein [Tanacetum coccineum]